MVVTLFVISVIVFFLVRLQGDPVSVLAPPTFSTEQVEALRRAWGLDQPLPQQYVTFLRKAVTGDFGKSIQYGQPAMQLVMERLAWTYVLAGAAALIGLAIALPMGVISAVHRNGPIDLLSSTLATLGTAMPSFWLGLMFVLLFSVHLRLLPVFGAMEPAAIIMPAATLGIGMAARLSRLTRSSVPEVLRQDYIRTARSKGLAQQVVVVRHALRNALMPVVTDFGLQLGWLLGGAVVVESVFAWPGLGRLTLEAINIRDITIVQGALMWYALSFMLINLLIDIAYAFLDPRIRYGG
jgi:peptide/nickel transport system permease protein